MISTESPQFASLKSLLNSALLEEDRTEYFMLPPTWHLWFKSGSYVASKQFLDSCVTTMCAVKKHPEISPPDFHVSTGVISRVLCNYIKEIKDIDKLSAFISEYRAFMRGESLDIPNDISDGISSYDILNFVTKNAYGIRLIEEYRQNLKVNTQDFALLYKVPLSSLIENVLTSIRNEEIVEFIEKHRM